MKILGLIFLIIIGIGVVAAIGMGLASIGDIKRYLKIRAM
jgi:hypothetical protein